MTNKTTKIFAFLALFGILISVVWTGLVIFFWDSKSSDKEVITQEEINKLINEQNTTISFSGSNN